MYDISPYYDINKLPERIKEIRQLRSRQYKEYLKNPDFTSPEHQKYAPCKSQETLAEAINVKRQTIIDWEKGHSTPSLENLIQLCAVFNCNMDYLLGSVKTPITEPISIAHYFSGISSEIIEYGLEHKDYLDCLNFFMLPKNCASFFNDVTITAWRKFWADSALLNIKSPFKEDVIKAYDEYYAITPITEVTEKTYKDFLEKKFPKQRLILKKEHLENGYKIKGCFHPVIYQNFFENKDFNYSSFINYLVDSTFKPLSYNAFIESQKIKLCKAFIDLFTKYLEEE